MRILLIGCVVMVVLVMVVVGLGIWYVETHKNEIAALGKGAMTEGRQFGRTANESQCLEEGLVRTRSTPGFTAAVQNNLWLASCLNQSAPFQSFCAGVPQATEFTATYSWRTDECKRRGLARNALCPSVFSAVQNYCYSPGRQRKLEASTRGQ